MLLINGANGEGGGQILRTALALSTVTQTPFRMERIRALRQKPGLMRQHLTCVLAAAQMSDAEVTGAEIGSLDLVFKPKAVRAGRYHFAIGTAGSTTLVLQTMLYGLIFADGPSDIVIEGGTHNPNSPAFDFLERAFLPLLKRMGGQVQVRIEQAGFYPGGGGRISARILPAAKLARIELLKAPQVAGKRATVLIANMARDIAERQLAIIEARLGITGDIVELKRAPGAGNAIAVDIENHLVTEVFTGFGERGIKAEDVANGVADEVEEYLNSGVAVGRHLADQLILPMALGSGGAFRTLSLTEHTTTQLETVRQFLNVKLTVEPNVGAYLVQVV